MTDKMDAWIGQVFEMPADEPLEVRMVDNLGNRRNYTGHRNERGMIVHHLVSSNGTPLSLTYVLDARTDAPSKAVDGWQVEMLDLFRAAHGQTILEVR